jgi:hypothetical protein
MWYFFPDAHRGPVGMFITSSSNRNTGVELKKTTPKKKYYGRLVAIPK